MVSLRSRGSASPEKRLRADADAPGSESRCRRWGGCISEMWLQQHLRPRDPGTLSLSCGVCNSPTLSLGDGLGCGWRRRRWLWDSPQEMRVWLRPSTLGVAPAGRTARGGWGSWSQSPRGSPAPHEPSCCQLCCLGWMCPQGGHLCRIPVWPRGRGSRACGREVSPGSVERVGPGSRRTTEAPRPRAITSRAV